MKHKNLVFIALAALSFDLSAQASPRRSDGGQFTATEDWSHGAYFGTRGTFFADVTGDGKADAIVVNDNTVTVRPSDGKQFIANQDWSHGAYFGTRGTFFADVTGDGKADAIVVNDNTVTVRPSDGKQFIGYKDWTPGAYFGTRGTFFADVTGDGKADAIVVNDNTVTVRPSKEGQFAANEDWSHGAYFGTRGTFFADVTGDGKADAIAVNDNTVTVRRSDGGQFTANEDWTHGAYFGTRGTFFADVTGDGKADAIVVNDNTVTVRPSKEGQFTANEDWTHGAYYGSRGTFFTDVNGDGKADAIVVNNNTVTVRRSDLYIENIYVEIDKSVSGVLPAKPPYTEPPRIKPDGSVEKGVIRQPLSGVPDKMWNPDQTLKVRMTGGSAMVRSKVRQYAVEWSQYANINFAFVDDRQPAEIKIDFEKNRSSWSVIGRDALSIPFNFSTMHFGWFDDNTPDVEFSRVVLHEFGHALGLIHEHQSPASGIQWDKEKTYKFYREDQGWDKGMVDRNVFEKYNVTSTNYSQFDPTSIMMYPIPAELTLDGRGTRTNTTLSDIDKKYIRQWYPYPGDATGQLRTGDDCDLIEFSVEYRVVAADLVTFRLNPGSNVTWWKSIEVPIGGSGYIELEIHDQVSSVRDISRSDIDNSRPIRFNKAKFLGIHTPLQYRWDVLSALPGGTRVTLNWVKDHCP